MRKCAKIEFKLIRSFGVGFTIYSPKLNSLAFDITIGCFNLSVWAKGEQWFGVGNYWNG